MPLGKMTLSPPVITVWPGFSRLPPGTKIKSTSRRSKVEALGEMIPLATTLFPQGVLALHQFLAQLLVLLSQLFELFEQRAARHYRIADLLSELLDRTGHAEERQEQSSPGELDSGGWLLGQIEQHQHDQQHQARRYGILPFKHRSPRRNNGANAVLSRHAGSGSAGRSHSLEE